MLCAAAAARGAGRARVARTRTRAQPSASRAFHAFASALDRLRCDPRKHGELCAGGAEHQHVRAGRAARDAFELGAVQRAQFGAGTLGGKVSVIPPERGTMLYSSEGSSLASSSWSRIREANKTWSLAAICSVVGPTPVAPLPVNGAATPRIPRWSHRERAARTFAAFEAARGRC
jgi:hypothetical protein